jgi:hypothetical protein
MSELLIFDLESEGLSEAEIRAVSDPYPPFDPTTVKYGNLKPENRPAKLEEKRLAYVEEEAAYWKDKVDQAALSAMTGRVLAIGYAHSDGTTAIVGVNGPENLIEREVIVDFFDVVSKSRQGASYKLAGFNIGEFDLPFIVRRAWALGIPVPQGLLPTGSSRFFWPSWFIDLRDIWTFGAKGNSDLRHGKLGQITKLLGLGEKNGEGKDFARLWRDPATREQARTYLTQDLTLTSRLAERLLSLTPSTIETPTQL